MEQATKFQLGIGFLVALSVFMYFNLPAGGGNLVEIEVDQKQAQNLDQTQSYEDQDYCQISRPASVCYSVFKDFRDNCGRRKEIKRFKIKEIQKEEAKVDKVQKAEKQSNLIYELLVVLLVVSVTASLADCFQEKKRRERNRQIQGDANTRGGRMSLADLTMSRHARRESQANFRPPAEVNRLLGRRSASQDSSQNKNCHRPTRQSSCPQTFLRRLSTIDLIDQAKLEEGWAEKRRVRMIQRH